MTPITYMSEQPKDFSDALDGADSLLKLIDVVNDWQELADDAQKIVLKMSADDFAEWRKGLLMERKGKFAGEVFAEKFGALLMPEKMFEASIVAIQYNVPWGLAYIRMNESKAPRLGTGE